MLTRCIYVNYTVAYLVGMCKTCIKKWLEHIASNIKLYKQIGMENILQAEQTNRQTFNTIYTSICIVIRN